MNAIGREVMAEKRCCFLNAAVLAEDVKLKCGEGLVHMV